MRSTVFARRYPNLMVTEPNGTGPLDRIEAALERLVAAQERDHEEFTRDHRQLMTWQVLMQEKMDKWATDRQAGREDEQAYRAAQRVRDEILNKRIADLVSAMGVFISQRPSV